MGRYQDAALPVGAGPQVFGLVHAELVAREAEGEHVAGVGVNLAAGQYQEAVPTGKLPDLIEGPESVVLGEADAVQPGGSRSRR